MTRRRDVSRWSNLVETEGDGVVCSCCRWKKLADFAKGEGWLSNRRTEDGSGARAQARDRQLKEGAIGEECASDVMRD